MDEIEQHGVKSIERRAKREEQRGKSIERRAKSEEHRAESCEKAIISISDNGYLEKSIEDIDATFSNC
ncbi:MAG: hypothetical protein H8E64_07105 [Candidatus Marinimicrobia bacterium]|nr:hypothetical protein [Candidatus Neomarinimicrobiota bacterium]